jgi:hypothetical protein
MAFDQPIDAVGQPLRQPQPAGNAAWQKWAQWSMRVEQRIANQSALLEGVLNTLERMAEAVVHERRERERVAGELAALKDRLDTVEAQRSVPAPLTHEESERLRGRLRGALAISLAEVASKRGAA